MFLVNFIFVISHLKIHTTVHLHNLKADAIVVKRKLYQRFTIPCYSYFLISVKK